MELRPNISAVRAISSSRSVGGELFIVANGARLSAVENFSKSTVVHTKMGHVSKTTPLFAFFVAVRSE